MPMWGCLRCSRRLSSFSASPPPAPPGQAPDPPRGGNRPRRGDQPARRRHLIPHVPQEHAAHAASLEVVYDALAELLLPVGDRLKSGVELAHRFLAELEQIR